MTSAPRAPLAPGGAKVSAVLPGGREGSVTVSALLSLLDARGPDAERYLSLAEVSEALRAQRRDRPQIPREGGL